MQLTGIRRWPLYGLTVWLLAGCIGSGVINPDSGDDNDNGGGQDETGRVFAVTTANRLVSFDEATPGTLVSSNPITGLSTGETIIGIDFRPADRDLYALGDQGNLYTLDPDNGQADRQTGINGDLRGAAFGIDFDPPVDRLRLLSDADQNAAVDPDDGSTRDDSTLVFAADDAHAGANPTVVAAAYTNSFEASTETLLYGLDSTLDVLTTQDPASDGELETVGSLGIDFSQTAAFDIDSAGRALAALNTPGNAASGLYQIDLDTGNASLLGTIAGGAPISSLAVRTSPPPTAFAVSDTNVLLSFDPLDPQDIDVNQPITGLQTNEFILAMALRPVNNELYALTNQDNIYTIDQDDAEADLESTLETSLSGNFFGMDFNAIEDRLRIVSDTGQNLSVDVDNGDTDGDDALEFDNNDDNEDATPDVVAVAYTNSFDTAIETTLYGVDAALDSLVTVEPVDNGSVNTEGDLEVDTSNLASLDIAGTDGLALAVLNSPNNFASQLFTLDLDSGAATAVDSLAGVNNIVGVAILLEESE